MEMKKIALMLIVLLCSSMFYMVATEPKSVGASTSSTAELSITPANVTNTGLGPGSTFTLALKLSNVADLYGYQYQIDWTQSVLQLVSVHDTIPLPSGYFLADNTTTAGQMTFTVTATSGSGVAGNFTLRTMVFKVLVIGETTIAISNDILSDSNANAISHSTVNGYFSNIPPPPTPELSIAPANVTNTALGPGSTFTLALKLSNVANMYSYQYQINWTQGVLQLVSVHDTVPFKGSTFLALNESNMKNGMSFTVTSIGAPSTAVRGNFTLRTMVFKVLVIGETTIAISNDILSNYSANAISHSTVNGYFSNIPPPYPILILADGSIYPWTAPIQRNGDIYTFTENITSDTNGIVVERSNIIIDGASYTLQGSRGGNGLALLGASNVTIKHVSISGFYSGIYLHDSSSNSISGNNIAANRFVGIELDSSSGNSISGNYITANIDVGIMLNYSSGNSVSGNNIKANGEGIMFESSSGNSVSGNNITGDGFGIELDSSSGNSVSGNNITACSYNALWLADSLDNNISGNNVTSNNYGIVLGYSSDNSVSGNNIRDNTVGISIQSSSYNTFYHNNFTNNTRQMSTDGSPNTWDDGYPLGGNYWSDSNKTDLYGGAGQNVTGSDGICDKPHAMDRYPLVSPYPSHDLAVTDLEASKTILGKGSGLVLSVTIANMGDFTENVSFSVSLNSTVISNSTFSSPFEIRQSTSILLTPITANLAYGNYTAKVHVTSVAGEANLTNNDKSCWFFVTIPGDVNGDKKVNVLDLILIATHLGIVGGNGYAPYTADWYKCMNTDLNNDGQHNVLDLIVCAIHLGQHW